MKLKGLGLGRNGKASRREQTRARIFRAARKVIAKHGIDDATIRKIADEADVSPALVMQYFSTKAALVQEVFLDSNKILLEIFADKVKSAESFHQLTMSAIESFLARDLRSPALTRQVMAFTWTWGPEQEEKFRTTLHDMSAIIADSLAARFLPQDRHLTRAASFALINTYVGLLRIALQEDWPPERVLTAVEPSVRIILAGLEQVAQKADAAPGSE